MKFTKDLAAIHGYLCADGYVIKNPKTQRHRYYHIGLRNTNDTLLMDFQTKFLCTFGIKPIITNDGRCRIQSREIFERLTEGYSYYSHEWKMPDLPKSMAALWLRAFFDCEGWVEIQKGKSRSVRAECVNLCGLQQVRDGLKRFNIDSSIKKRNRPIWRISICGLDDLRKFKDEIGFLHPHKLSLLDSAISSYKNYEWHVPEEKSKLIKFINERGSLRAARKEIRLFSIKKNNLDNVKSKLNLHGINCSVHGPWKNSYGSRYYMLVLKLDELIKLE